MNSEEINIAYAIKEYLEAKESNDKLKNMYKLLNLLTKKLIEIGKDNVPMNIPEVIKFVIETNMNEYLGTNLPNCVAVNSNMEFTKEFLELVNEDSSEEKVQKIMLELLKFLREPKKKEN